MTVTWYDLYPSKLVEDANGKSATRLIRVFGDAVSSFDQNTVFLDFISGASAPTSPAGGIPQRGDFFPGDNTMIAGARRVESINGPSDVTIRIDYSRVNWGSIDTFYPGDDSSMIPPFILLNTSGQRVVSSIPRVIAFPFVNDANLIYQYSVTTEPRTRFQTSITATFHRENWTQSDIEIVEDYVGTIDSDISVEIEESGFSAQAMFTNYRVNRLGQNLYRITYEWLRMANLKPLEEEIVDVPENANPIRRLAVPEVDPHSNLQVIQRPLETALPSGQIAVEPLLLQTEPIDNRAFGVTTDLPGLTYASLTV